MALSRLPPPAHLPDMRAARFLSDSGWVFYKFIFAMQSPRLACFLGVEPVEDEKGIIASADFDRLAVPEWEHTL